MTTVIIIALLAVNVFLHWAASKQRAYAQSLVRLIEAGVFTRAMMDGHRLVVTKAPDGMTIAEAQAEIDRIWASLQCAPKPGVGGELN